MVLLISASLTEAALIDNGTFTTDTASGLDWLDMSNTDGNSYNQTLTAISAGGSLDGWRFATSAEFDGLINAAVGSPYTPALYDAAIYSQMQTLINLLGSTIANEGTNGYSIGYVDSSALWYADARQFGWSEILATNYGYVRPASSTAWDATKATTNSSVGAFLVRTSVPDTGSTAALLGVGVVALAAARRRLG
ncbi:MAG: VPDSG-CTERM sorting domain-containing protein [Opitutaceae bacterium]|nr:VPDSG-CTERM sorting domain-containing protein [Opitutaceae bacterium]